MEDQKIYFIVESSYQWSEFNFSDYPAIIPIEKSKFSDNIEEYTKDAICIDNTRDFSFIKFLLSANFQLEKDTILSTDFIRLGDKSRMYLGTEDMSKIIKLLMRATKKFTSIKIVEKKEIETVDTIIAESNSRTLHLVRSMPTNKEENKNYILLEDAKELSRVFDIIDSME